MRQRSFADMHCSIARSLELVGDWWSPLILRDVYLGLDRFDQLVTDLGISRNLLSERLRALVAGGVLERDQYQIHPPRNRYLLTTAGREFVPILLALMAWGDRWAAPPGGAPMQIVHTTCGAWTHAAVHCAACGDALTADTVAVAPGPGGEIAAGTALMGQVFAARRRPRPGPPRERDARQ